MVNLFDEDSGFIDEETQQPLPEISIEFGKGEPGSLRPFPVGSGVRPPDPQPVDDSSQTFMRGVSAIYGFLAPSEESKSQLEAKQQRNQEIADELGMTVKELQQRLAYGDKTAQLIKDKGFELYTPAEDFTRVRDFLYGEQQKAYEKRAAGIPHNELPLSEKIATFMMPIDVLDFIGLGVGVKALIKAGIKKFAGDASKKSVVDLVQDQELIGTLSDAETISLFEDVKPLLPGEERDAFLRFAKGKPTKKKTAGVIRTKDEAFPGGLPLKGFDESLMETKPLKEIKTKDELPAPPIRKETGIDTPTGQPRDIIKDVDEEDIFLAPGKPLQEETAVKPTTVAKDPVVVELKTKIPEFKNLSSAEKQVVAQKFVQSMLNPIKRKELVESLPTGQLARVERYARQKGLATEELLDISERSRVSVGSLNRMTPEVRKNMAKRFSEVDYDELPLGGPDPIRQIINEERKAAGLQEIAPGTEPATIINRLNKYGELDAETAKKLADYRDRRRVFINKNTRQGGIKTFFDERAKEKADAALDVINKINKDRETPAKFTAETFVQELKKQYPKVFVDDYSQKTSRRGLIKRLKKIHPEIADSLVGPGQKLKKGTFDISEGGDTQQNIFGDLFSNKFKSGQDPITLLTEDPETRFFNNLRRSSNQSAEDFFETVKLEDIQPGGNKHKDFLKFKKIDETRLEANERLKPVLRKIFDKIRLSTAKDRALAGEGLDAYVFDSISSVQLGHRFKLSGVTEGFAADKIGKGAKAEEIYLDISDYNSYIQNGLENEARKNYKLFQETGDQKFMDRVSAISEDMAILGIEGQVAPGVFLGEQKDFVDKLAGLVIPAMNSGLLTPTEVQKAITAANKIATAQKAYEKMFKIPANFAYGGMVEQEDLDIFQDDLPEGSFEVASLKLPFFKMLGKAPVNEVAPIPTPKEKLANPTKKQKESLETEKAKRAEEDIFDPTPGEAVMPESQVATTPLTNQPMTSVFYSDIERALTNAPDEFPNKQAVLDFMNKNRIKKSEVEDYRIPSLLKLYDDDTPITKQQILSQVRTAPISGLRVHGTGKGSDIINPNGVADTRYTGYAEPGFIPDTQRERVLYLNRNKLPGDTGEYPQSMFGGENIQRHGFGIPNEDNTYIVGWTRLTDRFGFVPPKVAGPETKVNVRQLSKEITKNNRTLAGLFGEAKSKLERLANQRGMNQADIDEMMEDFGDEFRMNVVAKYADQLNEVSPGLVDQMDELVVKNNALQEQVTKASAVDPSGVVRVTFADEIQSDLLQAAAARKQQLAAALRKIQEEGLGETNLQGLSRLAEQTINFYEKNKSVFRPLKKSEAEIKATADRIAKLDAEVDEIVNKYIQTREASDADLSRLSGLLNENLDNMLKEIIEIDSSAMDGLFPDLPFKNRDEWADALIKKDLYELAYRKFVLKDPDASEYYAVSPSNYVIDRYKRSGTFEGNAATPQEVRDMEKASRIETFKREGRFVESKYKGIGMDEFYGGPNSVDQKGKHYTSTLEKILKKQAQSNNSEIITMPVQVKSGEGSAYFKITDQNDNMVATLTNGDQARELLIANPNYKVETITVPNKASMEPVFAIKITPEMLEPYKTHKAQGGLVEHIDIFEV